MKIKRYTARNMPEALRKVREDLGEEAVILHSKSTGAKGLRGVLSTDRVEVIAAADVLPPEGETPAHEPQPAPFPALKTEPALEDSLRRIEKRIEEISSRVTRERETPTLKVPPAWAGYADLLAGQGVAPGTAREIVLAAARSAQKDSSLDPVTALRGAIESRFRTCPPIRTGGDIPAVAAFIGPTGVGKTTTLAKIAATHFQRGERVVLVTADTYRLAAVEQLRRYADIMDIPLEVVRATSELPDALRRHRDADLILIDTAGRSQNHRKQMGELASLLRPIRGADIYLVLAATASPQTLRHQAARFSPAEPNRLVLTKVDELPSGALILEAAAACPLPIAYITHGQEVPGDYQTADRTGLARLALSGEPSVVTQGEEHARVG